MSVKHTPGPWKVLPRPLPSGTKYEIWQAKRAQESWRIAEVVFPHDAAVIASAPDLLKAAKALLDKLNAFCGCNEHDMDGPEEWPEFVAIRAAIAKAEAT